MNKSSQTENRETHWNNFALDFKMIEDRIWPGVWEFSPQLGVGVAVHVISLGTAPVRLWELTSCGLNCRSVCAQTLYYNKNHLVNRQVIRSWTNPWFKFLPWSLSSCLNEGCLTLIRFVWILGVRRVLSLVQICWLPTRLNFLDIRGISKDCHI